jgi:hypothetical protein
VRGYPLIITTGMEAVRQSSLSVLTNSREPCRLGDTSTTTASGRRAIASLRGFARVDYVETGAAQDVGLEFAAIDDWIDEKDRPRPRVLA